VVAVPSVTSSGSPSVNYVVNGVIGSPIVNGGRVNGGSSSVMVAPVLMVS